jgi:hypothetical protein
VLSLLPLGYILSGADKHRIEREGELQVRPCCSSVHIGYRQAIQRNMQARTPLSVRQDATRLPAKTLTLKKQTKTDFPQQKHMETAQIARQNLCAKRQLTPAFMRFPTSKRGDLKPDKSPAAAPLATAKALGKSRLHDAATAELQRRSRALANQDNQSHRHEGRECRDGGTTALGQRLSHAYLQTPEELIRNNARQRLRPVLSLAPNMTTS